MNRKYPPRDDSGVPNYDYWDQEIERKQSELNRRRRKETIQNEAPADVKMVWAIQAAGIPIGTKVYERCEEIKKKYPEWFENK